VSLRGAGPSDEEHPAAVSASIPVPAMSSLRDNFTLHLPAALPLVMVTRGRAASQPSRALANVQVSELRSTGSELAFDRSRLPQSLDAISDPALACRPAVQRRRLRVPGELSGGRPCVRADFVSEVF
jgi:hypothetical protein